MAQNNNGLPEGTDTVIEAGGTGGSGAGQGSSGTINRGGSPSSATNSTGARTSTTSSDSQTDSLITAGSSSTGSSTGSSSGFSESGSAPTGPSSSGSDGASGSSSGGGIRGMVSNVSTKARDEAANRARGLVGNGLKSGSSTLGNIASIIEETVEQIGERLGPQYGDYARTASQTVQRYATTLENKDPDELVDDARNLVRKSPGVALAGAAILGFGLVRLLKAGMPQEGSDGTRDRQSDRAGTTR